MTYISTAERIGRAEGKAEGRAEGRAEGKAEGRAEGKAEGRAEGKAEGRAEGKAEGRAEGLELGRTEALREMVLRLAQKRFGALSSELTNAITKLALAQLDELTLLLLDFATPADLEAWLRQVDPAAS
jgi:flagellar biosynthesis/type III secretory pathway protein FliH